jgi:Arc/MetJ-type ribon-helix-helix transcriptional regulator
MSSNKTTEMTEKEEIKMSESGKQAKDDFKKFVGSARKAAEELGSDIARSAEKLVDELRNMKRQLVISVRLDDETVSRVEQLIEADLCRSRSEAVAFLTREGIRARQDLFAKIDAKIEEIRRIKDEIKNEVL